jgi:hypothetical protein
MVRYLCEMDSEDQEIHPQQPNDFDDYVDQLQYFIRACDSVKKEAQNLLDHVNSTYADDTEYNDKYANREKKNALGKITIKLMMLRNNLRKLY